MFYNSFILKYALIHVMSFYTIDTSKTTLVWPTRICQCRLKTHVIILLIALLWLYIFHFFFSMIILLWLLSKHQIKHYNNKKYYIMSHTFHLVQKEIRYFIRKLVIFPIEYALVVFIGKYRWKYFFSGITVGKEEIKKKLRNTMTYHFYI